MLIIAPFTTARTWKQPRCPSTDEWVKKVYYAHIMEHHSATERNASESVLMRWMNLEPIIEQSKSDRER